MSDDSELQSLFASLRRAEEASTPGFDRVMARGRHRSAGNGWLIPVGGSVALTVAALTVVALVVLRQLHPQAPATGQPMLTDWHAPTDFLLDTPGRQLLQTIPDIGRYPTIGVGSVSPTHFDRRARSARREHL